MEQKNISKLTVNETISTLLEYYSFKTPKKLRSIFLWGSPGIGKSALVKQMAELLGKQLNKRTKVTDVRLLLFNPIDLRGLPVADIEKQLAIWLKPQIFNMEEGDDIINFLFLDELSAAPPSVQAAAYQITLDKVIGEHKLPDNCIVIAAGNKVTDKSTAYKMPKALCNRMIHIEITTTVPDWKQWAIPMGVDPRIIGFLNWKENALFQFEPNSDDLAYPSPRSWEMVHEIIEGRSDITKVIPLVNGSIGFGTSTEFINYCELYKTLPDIENIFAGRPVESTDKPDVLYAISSSLVLKLSGRKPHEIDNMFRYLKTIRGEICVLTILDAILIKDVRVNIMQHSHEFTNWWFPKYGSMIMN